MERLAHLFLCFRATTAEHKAVVLSPSASPPTPALKLPPTLQECSDEARGLGRLPSHHGLSIKWCDTSNKKPFTGYWRALQGPATFLILGGKGGAQYTVPSSSYRTRGCTGLAPQPTRICPSASLVPLSTNCMYFCGVLLVEIISDPLNFLHCTEQGRSSLYGLMPPPAVRWLVFIALVWNLWAAGKSTGQHRSGKRNTRVRRGSVHLAAVTTSTSLREAETQRKCDLRKAIPANERAVSNTASCAMQLLFWRKQIPHCQKHHFWRPSSTSHSCIYCSI